MWPFTCVQPETVLPWSVPASRLAGSGRCPRGFGQRITRLPARVGTPGHRRVRRDWLLSTLLDQPFWSHRLKARVSTLPACDNERLGWIIVTLYSPSGRPRHGPGSLLGSAASGPRASGRAMPPSNSSRMARNRRQRRGPWDITPRSGIDRKRGSPRPGRGRGEGWGFHSPAPPPGPHVAACVASQDQDNERQQEDETALGGPPMMAAKIRQPLR